MHGLTRAGLVAALLVGSLVLPQRAAGQDDPDDRVGAAECCLPLLFPIGARAVGLGNALTARGGADALFVNPAGLAALDRDEFRIHNANTDIETSNTFGVAFGISTAGILALSYRLVDYGTFTATGKGGEITGEVRIIEHMLLSTFATQLGGGLAAGITYKIYQSRQSCSGFCEQPPFAATTHGIDFGVQYHPPLWKALQLGTSITHFGLPLQVINAEQTSPTPARVRAGAAYEVLHHFAADSAVSIWLSTDVAASWRQGVPATVGVGAEVIMDNTIFVRAGYASGGGRNAGAGVGLGLRYDRFDIGIARSFVDAGATDRDPFQITFSVAF
ncbi:MAG TPA: PorV/PorQ family protein [Longimicrobiales bacterium]|nr:PorV/PorQ family protein [Longimicrobiales bacterium]